MPLRGVVQATCRRWRMFTPGTRTLVAVSGGPDSVALLLVLDELAPELLVSLGVAHLNHGIRGATADRDECFVRDLAGSLRLPFYSARRDVPGYAASSGMSMEEAARAVRYDFLRETAAREGYSSIAVGHTQDDQAETVLIALLRGSALSGLGGMPPVLGPIVRPLIATSRADVLTYLRERGAAYCNDETNAELAYTRNRVRHLLLPLLEREFNPGIRATLARNALLIQDDDAWLRQLTQEFLARAGLRANSTAASNAANTAAAGDAVSLDRKALVAAPVALRRRALREAVTSLMRSGMRFPPAGPSAANIEDLMDMLASGRTGARLDLPGGIQAELCYEDLVLHGPRGAGGETARRVACARELELAIPGTLSAGGDPAWTIRARVAGREDAGPACPVWRAEEAPGGTEFTAYLDFDRLLSPLKVRTRKRGDRFWPQGAPSERKLKDFLIDVKVPRAARDRLPVLCDASGRICAVLPLRAGDWATVGASTRRVLILEGRILTAPGVDPEHRA